MSASAWDALERLAGEMVRKSGGDLTRDQAFDRALQTPQGRALYAEYSAEQLRGQLEERSQVAEGRSLLRKEDESGELTQGVADDAWAAIEKAADELVEKSGESLSRAKAIDGVLRRRPELYTAYESALATEIAKADPATYGGAVHQSAVEKAEAAIQKAAAGVLARDPGLSAEQAIARALKSAPELYASYMTAQQGGAVDGTGRSVGDAAKPPARPTPARVTKAEQDFLDALQADPAGTFAGLRDALERERVAKAGGPTVRCPEGCDLADGTACEHDYIATIVDKGEHFLDVWLEGDDT